MQPYREVFWNIPSHLLFYALAAVASTIFLFGLFRRWKLWRSGWAGKQEVGFGWRHAFQRIFLNTSIFKGDPLGGVTHLCIMWGFILLFLGTILSTTDHWIFPYLRGKIYLIFAFMLDLAGLLLIAGILLAYLRRYVFKREKMVSVPRDHFVLALLLFIALSGFMVEGLRLRAQALPWHEPSPVGQWIAGLLGPGGGDLFAHKLWWWIHALSSLFFIAYFPFSKLIHVFAASLNLAIEGMGYDSFVTAGQRQSLVADFSFRHLLMFDACTQCNRCQVVCPSSVAKEPLSPRRVIEETGRFARRKAGFGLMPSRHGGPPLSKAAAVPGDAIWYCTTCSHCYRECPSAISPMDIIGEVRSARIEEGEDVPENVQEMLESIHRYRNPFRGAKGKRMDWASGLDVPVFPNGTMEKVCLHIGCTIAYDPKLHPVARSAVNLFKATGRRFAVLGKDEVCCGEFTRAVGEEGLFEELSAQNMDAFGKYGIEEIITLCPHGYHTFGNEYRRVEPSMKRRRVSHVSQWLEALLVSHSLVLENLGERAVTYHDPCFLGRRNGIYDAPRNVLKAIPGVRLFEMQRSRERSFCCGGGGGRMWVEAREGEKIAEVRVREAVGTGAEIIVTACPLCFSNLDDAVNTGGFEGRIVVKDLVELVAECLPRDRTDR